MKNERKPHQPTPPKKKSRPAPRAPLFNPNNQFQSPRLSSIQSVERKCEENGISRLAVPRGGSRGPQLLLRTSFPLPTSKKQTRLVSLECTHPTTDCLTALLLLSLLALSLPLSLETVRPLRSIHSAVVAIPNTGVRLLVFASSNATSAPGRPGLPLLSVARRRPAGSSVARHTT